MTATRVLTEISIKPRVPQYQASSASPIDILVMRVNNFFNEPFSYYFYNNSIVLLFPLEYLFKYLRRSFATSQISATQVRVTRNFPVLSETLLSLEYGCCGSQRDIYLFIIAQSVPFGFGRASGFTSLLSISLLIYLPSLLSTLLYRTLLIILSLKTMATFGLLPPCCASLLSFLPVFY